MSKGTESNFWNLIRNNLPKKCHATRIENKHGGGIPDVHMVWEGLPFWIELKTTKNNTIKISPNQIAWNMAYSARGGLNFYLVKSLSLNKLFLFRGDQGASILDQGLCVSALFVCESASQMFASLRPLLLDHYINLLD